MAGGVRGVSPWSRKEKTSDVTYGLCSLKTVWGQQGGVQGVSPGWRKERKVILDPMYNLRPPESRKEEVNPDGYFCPALKVKRSTLRGTRQKILV